MSTSTVTLLLAFAAGLLVFGLLETPTESSLRSLRRNMLASSTSVKASDFANASGTGHKLTSATGCGRFLDANSCNSNTDERGNSCYFCTDHLEKEVCVGEDDMGYKFAPCNKWLCIDFDDPLKNDISSCERT